MSSTEKIPLKPSARKKSSPKSNKQVVSGESPQERIAVTAYLLAEKRGFASGYELEDWFEAERIIQELSS